MNAPRYPGTAIRNVRVRDELWHAAKAKAAREGTTLTAVIVAALKDYVKEGDGDE